VPSPLSRYHISVPGRYTPTLAVPVLVQYPETEESPDDPNNCWLLNTGWSGKPAGESNRIKIAYSRAMVRAILDGSLEKQNFSKDPHFGFLVPNACEGVPSEILDPHKNASDIEHYEKRAKKLTDDFKENFRKFEKNVVDEVKKVML
jgi:phosphoenolpyruvate carboxykinase (ATP)